MMCLALGSHDHTELDSDKIPIELMEEACNISAAAKHMFKILTFLDYQEMDPVPLLNPEMFLKPHRVLSKFRPSIRYLDLSEHRERDTEDFRKALKDWFKLLDKLNTHTFNIFFQELGRLGSMCEELGVLDCIPSGGLCPKTYSFSQQSEKKLGLTEKAFPKDEESKTKKHKKNKQQDKNNA
jgi:hypothetical protein